MTTGTRVPQGSLATQLTQDLEIKLAAGIIGVEWNQNTDTWRRIDKDGNTLGFTPDFDKLSPWKDMIRVTMDSKGRIKTYGHDGKGSNLTLDGSDGEVFVRVPRCYFKAAMPSANVYQWYCSPLPYSGFERHPAFVQRGGVERDFVYIGAYDAGIGYVNHTTNTKVLQSRSGVQPYTGNADCIWEVPFTAGANEPAIGDSLSTPTEGGFLLVDYVVTSGSWAGSDAAGNLLIRKPGDTTCGWTNTETITNNTQGNTLGTSGTPVGETANMATCRTYAENILDSSFGNFSPWSLSLLQTLIYIEYADPDVQTTIGKGIVDKASGTGFNGELTGADGIDDNLATNGTGAGTGTDGLTPVAWRGIENLWGNVWQFVDGYEAVDAEYRLINRDGSGTFANPMAGGDYEASLVVPIVADGYISNIVYEDLLKYVYIAAAVAGSSATYLYDCWYAHDATETNILLAGGAWPNGVSAGVDCRASHNVATAAAHAVGARLEFIG